MIRTNFTLIVLVFGLALSVVYMRHQSRQLFVQLQELKEQRDTLNTEWGKLLLEEGAWSQHQRIEKLARSRLDMSLPAQEQVEIVVQRRP